MRDFRKWQVWGDARKFVKAVYLLSGKLPNEEKFGLISQIRRAAVSIPANIAEGAGRKSEKELNQFLHTALSSAFETETLLLLTVDVGLLNQEDISSVYQELTTLQKRLNAFINKLKG